MSTAGSKPTNLTFTGQFVGKNGAAFTKGVGVVVDAVASDGTVTVDVAAAGENCIGVYYGPAVTGDGSAYLRDVALLAGGGTNRVKASGTCTAGSYAKAGTGGFQDATPGGGTTALYLAGQFLESGVSGDFVEMVFLAVASVSA